jgi:TonB family protein
MNRVFALAPLLLACAASPLAAQATPAAARWHEVMRGDDGRTYSIDTDSIGHPRDSAFVVRTAVRLPRPVRLENGPTIDRQDDVNELDCAAARTRWIRAIGHLDAAVVGRWEMNRAWMPVDEESRPVFAASCAYLLARFAGSPPTGYELSAVDRMPEMMNRAEVARAIGRAIHAVQTEARVLGSTTVRMRIREDGSVDRETIRVLASTHPDLTAPAVRVVEMMRFRPALVSGVAVPVWVEQPVTFDVTR